MELEPAQTDRVTDGERDANRSHSAENGGRDLHPVGQGDPPPSHDPEPDESESDRHDPRVEDVFDSCVVMDRRRPQFPDASDDRVCGIGQVVVQVRTVQTELTSVAPDVDTIDTAGEHRGNDHETRTDRRHRPELQTAP